MQKEVAERELYISNIRLAAQCWEQANILAGQRTLDGCPKKYRNWEWGRLHLLFHQEIMSLSGHSGCVDSVAFSPDGRRLAASNGYNVLIFNAHDWE